MKCKCVTAQYINCTGILDTSEYVIICHLINLIAFGAFVFSGNFARFLMWDHFNPGSPICRRMMEGRWAGIIHNATVVFSTRYLHRRLYIMCIKTRMCIVPKTYILHALATVFAIPLYVYHIYINIYTYGRIVYDCFLWFLLRGQIFMYGMSIFPFKICTRWNFGARIRFRHYTAHGTRLHWTLKVFFCTACE